MESTDDRPIVYFDDLHLGQRFVSRTHRIDESQITDFALQFDPQPFHTDSEAAKGTLFHGLVASGWHTGAISMRLLVESGPHIAGGMVGVNVDISWPQPTRPGTLLHVESEIVELKPSRSKPDRGIAVIRSETRDEHGELLQTMRATVIVPRRV